MEQYKKFMEKLSYLVKGKEEIMLYSLDDYLHIISI